MEIERQIHALAELRDLVAVKATILGPGSRPGRFCDSFF